MHKIEANFNQSMLTKVLRPHFLRTFFQCAIKIFASLNINHHKVKHIFITFFQRTRHANKPHFNVAMARVFRSFGDVTQRKIVMTAATNGTAMVRPVISVIVINFNAFG